MFNLANVTFDKVKIRDLVESQYAGEWGDESYFPNANVIRATEIKNDGEINYSTAVKRKIDPQQLERKKLHCGDILVEGSGGSPTQPVGRIAYFNKNSDENFICSNFFRVIRLKSNINSKYIFWLLHYIYFQPIIMRFQQQTTGLINFKFQEYLDLEISVPSNPKDQEYIATVLDNLQNLINLQKDIISKLVSKKQGLLNDLLTRGVDSHGNLRPSYEDAPDLYQETELGFIPKEWEIIKLDEISEKVTDGTHQAVTTIPLNHEGVSFLFVSCVKEGKILWNKAGKISRRDYQELSKGREPKKGMIIYTVVGSYGDAAALEDDREVAFQRNTACIYPNTKLISSNFLVSYLNSESVRKHADRVALGNAQKLITLGELKKYLVALPPLQEQKLIEEKLKVVTDNISFEKENLDKLMLIKTGLLKDLLQN